MTQTYEFVCAVCDQLCVTRTAEAEANCECDNCYAAVKTSAPHGAGEGVAQRNTPPQEKQETEK